MKCSFCYRDVVYATTIPSHDNSIELDGPNYESHWLDADISFRIRHRNIRSKPVLACADCHASISKEIIDMMHRFSTIRKRIKETEEP